MAQLYDPFSDLRSISRLKSIADHLWTCIKQNWDSRFSTNQVELVALHDIQLLNATAHSSQIPLEWPSSASSLVSLTPIHYDIRYVWYCGGGWSFTIDCSCCSCPYLLSFILSAVFSCDGTARMLISNWELRNLTEKCVILSTTRLLRVDIVRQIAVMDLARLNTLFHMPQKANTWYGRKYLAL